MYLQENQMNIVNFNYMVILIKFHNIMLVDYQYSSLLIEFHFVSVYENQQGMDPA